MLKNFSDARAIIFDMDGVLFLSSDCHAKAFAETLLDAGIEGFSYSSIAGMRTDDAFRKIFSELGRVFHDGELENLVNRKRTKAIHLLNTAGEVAPKSPEVIAYLASKYQLALASSASTATVQLFLSRSGYTNAFEFVIDGSSVTHAKPAPDIYTLASEKLGLSPRQCVVVEDSLQGVTAGHAAGMPVIAISSSSTPEVFYHAGATHVIQHLQELTHIL